MIRQIKILGTGVALPKNQVLSAEIDEVFGLSSGQTEKTTGVACRYHANTETATDLAVESIHNALANANFSLDKIDCLVSASGTMEQAIPYNAAKIHARLKPNLPIPAFDINMTCLSALMAIDIAATMIHSQQYNTILIVSSDIASVGIDWQDQETRGLFGDGAAALIISRSTAPTQGLLISHFETHSEGLNYCQIKGGGSLHHPKNISGDYTEFGQFKMQGKAVFRLTASVIQPFIKKTLSQCDLSLDDINWIVPHQASHLALLHLQKTLHIKPEKVINIIANRGNQIAASLPSALHTLLQSKRAKAGDKILLIGTSAGLSLGAAVLIL